MSDNGSQSGRHAASQVSVKLGEGADSSDGQEHLIRVRKKHSHKRRARRRVLIGIAVAVLVVVVAFGGLLAFQASVLASEAKAASSAASAAVSAVKSADVDKVEESTKELSASAENMSSILSQPQWAVASVFPVVGGDVSSAKKVANTLGDFSDNALAPLVAQMKETPLNTILEDGAIDLDAMQDLLDCVAEVAPVFDRDASDLSGIDSFAISQLDEKVTPLIDKFQDLNDAVQMVAQLAPVAGDLLGANGTKRYLIAAQCAAEIRSTGGFLGSMSTITFDNGRFELGDFDRAVDQLDEDTPAEFLSDNEIEIFGEWVKDSWDMGYDPNYPTAAKVWDATYESRNGVQIDGVLCLSPSLVQDVLGIVGGITLSDGTTMDGTNAAQVLQHDLYWKYMSAPVRSLYKGDPVDDYFGEAAQMTFHKLFDNMSAKTLMKFASALVDGMSDYRVMFWLDDEELQSKIAFLNCSGDLNTPDDVCQLGVFFCATGNKMGWYIDIDTQIEGTTTNPDGSTTYSLRSTFSYYVPEEELSTAGTYIGGGESSPPCAIWPSIYIYAPKGATFGSFNSDGCQFKKGTHNGLELYYDNEFNRLLPNSAAFCIYEITVPAGSPELTIRTTPTMTRYRS